MNSHLEHLDSRPEWTRRLRPYPDHSQVPTAVVLLEVRVGANTELFQQQRQLHLAASHDRILILSLGMK